MAFCRIGGMKIQVVYKRFATKENFSVISTKTQTILSSKGIFLTFIEVLQLVVTFMWICWSLNFLLGLGEIKSWKFFVSRKTKLLLIELTTSLMLFRKFITLVVIGLGFPIFSGVGGDPLLTRFECYRILFLGIS